MFLKIHKTFKTFVYSTYSTGLSNVILFMYTQYKVNMEAFGCCQAHQGLPVGFPLLQYSVLFTVESFSLLYLLFIS